VVSVFYIFVSNRLKNCDCRISVIRTSLYWGLVFLLVFYGALFFIYLRSPAYLMTWDPPSIIEHQIQCIVKIKTTSSYECEKPILKVDSTSGRKIIVVQRRAREFMIISNSTESDYFEVDLICFTHTESNTIQYVSKP